jgi:hypothetical protein
LLSGSYLNSSASFNTQINNNSSSINLLSGSYLNSSASFNTQILNNSSSIDLLSGSYLLSSSSFDSRIDVIESNYVTTGSNTLVGNQEIQGTVYVSNISNPFGFSTTSSLYTDGGLRVTKDAYISGSTFIAGNLTVYGTSSIEYVTSSTLIGLEFINLNTDTPSLRYAGINVFDSGSVGASGSLLYDSQNNQWLFVHAESGSTDIDSSILLFGPLTTNNLGSEPILQPNRILKTQSTNNHGHHVTQSAIIDNGSLVSIDYRVNVTGSVTATSFTGSLDGSNIVNSSISNAKLANSTISGKALGTNLDTLTIGTGLSGTSYNGSAAVTIANTGVTAFNTRTGGVSLQASDISGLAAGIVSGSSQVTGLTNTNLSGTAGITNANLANSSITVTAGTGMSGGGAVSLGGTATLTNAGVTSNVAGTGVSVSGATGAVTISIGQAVATSSTPTFSQVFASLNGTGENFKVGDDCWIGDINVANTLKIKGVQDATAGYITFGNQATALGLTNSTTLTWGGSFTATGDVTAYSDARVKENVNTIVGALDKVLALRGVTYTRTDIEDKSEKVGFIAQEVQGVLPQVVSEEQDKLSVAYGNITALHNEAIKELNTKVEAQQKEIDELKTLVNQLLSK